MTKRRFQRTVLLTGIIGLLLVGGYGLWLFQVQRHQNALDRQLIAALMKHDTDQALALVHAGADPNTRYTPTPPPSFQQWCDHLLHRSPLPTNDSPTALLIASGERPRESGPSYYSTEYSPKQGDYPQLVEAMIQHHAEIEAQDAFGYTSLHAAVVTRRPKTVGVLLKHNADANSRNIFGDTPLIGGMDSDASIARQLLEHGADPNLPDTKGKTPLQIARQYQMPAIVTLLHQHGAK